MLLSYSLYCYLLCFLFKYWCFWYDSIEVQISAIYFQYNLRCWRFIVGSAVSLQCSQLLEIPNPLVLTLCISRPHKPWATLIPLTQGFQKKMGENALLTKTNICMQWLYQGHITYFNIYIHKRMWRRVTQSHVRLRMANGMFPLGCVLEQLVSSA